MLTVLGEFWSHLRGMVTDTLRVYWRLFPQLTALQLLGYLGHWATRNIASSLVIFGPWLAVAVYSTGFVLLLAAIIVQLRLVGAHVGITDVAPNTPQDDREKSTGRLLSITLLPFLGIYAVLSYIEDSAQEMQAYSLSQTGLLATNLLSAFVPTERGGWFKLFAILALIYVVRRVLDLVHEHTNIRILGLLAAFCESFFLVSVVLAGTNALLQGRQFLDDTRVAQFVQDAVAGLGHSLHALHIDLPAFLTWFGHWFGAQLWPFVRDVFTAPLLWLGVAALIFGTHTLSMADLWSRGGRASDAVKLLAREDHRGDRAGSTAGRRAWLEIQEVFFGDIDDKFLPAWQALRLLLRAGALFLATYFLLHSVIEQVGSLARMGLMHLIGGHDASFWMVLDPLLNVPDQLALSVRLCLLVVAFHRCLLIFRDRADAAQRAAAQAPVAQDSVAGPSQAPTPESAGTAGRPT